VAGERFLWADNTPQAMTFFRLRDAGCVQAELLPPQLTHSLKNLLRCWLRDLVKSLPMCGVYLPSTKGFCDL